MKYNCQCKFCKNPLYRKPKYLASRSMVFCNRICMGNYHKFVSCKSEIKPCNFCGKEIKKTIRQLRLSKKGLHFCNNKCKNIFIARIKRDYENPKDHRSRRHRIISESNNQCQKCKYNEDVRMLDLHHVDGNHKNNNWSNLRCLCVWCHNLHHRCNIKMDIPILIDDNLCIIQE